MVITFILASLLITNGISSTVPLASSNDKAREIICDLVSAKAKFDIKYLNEKIQEAKPYTISVFRYNIDKLNVMGMLKTDEGKHFTALKPMCYNLCTGLDIKNDLII